ncbi:MAG: cytochrome b5-like heme/steroid binding domain-containing protein [Patescibacteria group bacterium]
MSSKALYTTIALVIIAGIGIFLFASSQKVDAPVEVSNTEQTQGTQATTTNSTEATSTAAKSFTLAEVSAHNTKADCWLVINAKVYDVTKMIANHGGGDAILEGCGKDATTLFMTRPMGSGTPHSAKAQSFLPNFLIGDLKI